MSAKILLVEDDENLRETLRDNLEDEGYAVVGAGSIADADEAMKNEHDLILLDIMLPDGNGYSFCQKLRAAGVDTPIIMLTARTLEEDIIKGFDAGADDYLGKPYRLGELFARTRALLRRRGKLVEAAQTIEFSGFKLDATAHKLHAPSGEEVQLTHKEFELLLFLAHHRGEALTRQRMLDKVWGEDVIVEGRTVDNFISNIKRKLDWKSDSQFKIETIRGVGYRLVWD